MKQIFLSILILFSIPAFGTGYCSSVFEIDKISNGEAKELFDFLVTDLGAPVFAFSHNYLSLVVLENINNGRFSVNFWFMNNDRNELKRVQNALLEDGLRNDHHIFSDTLDISRPPQSPRH